jgi:hypothetical protein
LLSCIHLALDQLHSGSKSPLITAGEQTALGASPLRRSEIMKTVADQFGETLAAAGVRRVYGIVGDSLAIEP